MSLPLAPQSGGRYSKPCRTKLTALACATLVKPPVNCVPMHPSVVQNGVPPEHDSSSSQMPSAQTFRTWPSQRKSPVAQEVPFSVSSLVGPAPVDVSLAPSSLSVELLGAPVNVDAPLLEARTESWFDVVVSSLGSSTPLETSAVSSDSPLSSFPLEMLGEASGCFSCEGCHRRCSRCGHGQTCRHRAAVARSFEYPNHTRRSRTTTSRPEIAPSCAIPSPTGSARQGHTRTVTCCDSPRRLVKVRVTQGHVALNAARKQTE